MRHRSLVGLAESKTAEPNSPLHFGLRVWGGESTPVKTVAGRGLDSSNKGGSGFRWFDLNPGPNTFEVFDWSKWDPLGRSTSFLLRSDPKTLNPKPLTFFLLLW